MPNPKVTATLQAIVCAFENPELDIPQAIAVGMFPTADFPCNKWSLRNRLLCWIAGTQDARGFRQWNEVNRYVKKGSKAFHILAPRLIKRETENGDPERVLAGFLTAPVFRLEDTEGEALEHQKLELPDLPLMDRARAWNIRVEAVSGDMLGGALGRFARDSKGEARIGLATPHEKTFFHELSHAADYRIKPLKGGQEPLQEIAAEMSAEALCRLVGKQIEAATGNTYRYIQHYADEIDLSPAAACLKVLGRVEKILELILAPVESQPQAAAA